MIATVLGQTGPNGKYFCPFCEIMLAQVVKGSPHSPVHLRKYLSDNSSNTATTFISRIFEGMTEMAKSFQKNGAKKNKQRNIKIVKNVPLIPAIGDIINNVSVMPLHISLGIGLQFLNIVENIAVALDIEVRKENGLTSDGVIEAFSKEHTIISEVEELSNQINIIKDEITSLKESKAEIRSSNPQHFEKQNGKSLPQNHQARTCRQQFNEITKQLTQNKSKLKKIAKDKTMKETELKKLDKHINQIKDPFKTKFDDLMDSLNLKTQVYHSGALVGNDIDRIFGKSNRENLKKVPRSSSL